ncbi:MAG: anhydro-N-acetylmuramic acid kinase [Pseudomonadota bacterium]
MDYVIGLMSGTSLDGIDAGLVEFSPARPSGQLLHTAYTSYPDDLRQQLLAIHITGADELHRAAQLANRLAEAYAQTISTLLCKAKIPPQQILAIGCHGQTVRHRPDAGYSIQLVNASLLAERSGIRVIADFRSRDIAAGGQGAPLVPAFHAAAMRHRTAHRAIVNIGGIANLTDLPPAGKINGFDCGPGNLLMDAWIQQHLGERYDRNGAWAETGQLLPSLLNTLASHDFFSMQPPKSAGREQFNMDWLKLCLSGNEAPEDVQATLLALTAGAIARAIETHCSSAEEVYVCGGGARNSALMRALKGAMPNRLVGLSDDLGVDADWLEAHAFAWLARQTLLGLPGNVIEVTGARHPCILGAIYPA